MESYLSGDLKTLADAYSAHIRGSNRIWLIAATLSLFVVTPYIDQGQKVRFITHDINSEVLYPVSAVLLSVMSLAFIIAHAQAIRAGEIYLNYLKTTQGKMLDGDIIMVNDAAHLLYTSSLNRVYPLTHYLNPRIGVPTYIAVKLVFSLIYFCFPPFGVIWSHYKLNWNPWLWPVTAIVLFVVLLALMKEFKWTIGVLKRGA